jgi:protein-arginine kinase activator protein McsA
LVAVFRGQANHHSKRHHNHLVFETPLHLTEQGQLAGTGNAPRRPEIEEDLDAYIAELESRYARSSRETRFEKAANLRDTILRSQDEGNPG